MHQRPYQKLIVWKEAHDLTLQIYRITAHFPSEERYGIVSQMRRASTSIPLNIAEGNEKRSRRERACFIERASASAEELHYACVLSQDLKYMSKEEFLECDDRIQRTSYLLHNLHASLIQASSSASSASSDSSASSASSS